jgi:putative hydrolase of the HAD superfamily
VSSRAVVSDFGGVLTAPLEALLAAFVEASGVTHHEFGTAMVRIVEEDGTHPLFALERGEITERAFLERIDAALSAVTGREIRTPTLAERRPSGIAPNHELFDYYRSLRERGVRMALCTNNVREWEPLWRRVLPIDDVFDVVVDSAFVGSRKPESRIYLVTLERLGLPGEECVFVDDLEVNVRAAEKQGMHGVWFRDTDQAIAEIEALLDLDQLSDPMRSQQ